MEERKLYRKRQSYVIERLIQHYGPDVLMAEIEEDVVRQFQKEAEAKIRVSLAGD